MPLKPEIDIDNIPPGRHGGPDYAELQTLGLSMDEIVDFSVCCNPYSLPAEIMRCLKKLPVHLYPDSDSTELKNGIARKLGIAPSRILVGSGTTELIRLLALVYFKKGARVLLFQPTYSEYELTARIFGAEIIHFQSSADRDFRLEAEEFARTIRESRPEVVFLCNPNNPTGQYLSREEVDLISAACGDSLLILDEAYLNFVTNPWSSSELLDKGNIVILRSMTKNYAIAGLRLGYMLARDEIINAVRRVCPPWNVNIAAQKVGLAALSADKYLSASLKKVRKSKQILVKNLSALGFRVLPSETNFFLVKVGDAGQFRRLLLKQGFLVRDCTSFGLTQYIRIGARTVPESYLFIWTLAKLRDKGELQIDGD